MGKDKEKNPKNPQVEPVIETAEPTPVVEGPKVVGLLEKFRRRTKDAKLKAKADEIHLVLMGVKPQPIKTKPSSGWVSYLSGKIRFAALEVNKNIIKVHSLELNNGKMVCQRIKIKPKDKVPSAKIRNRAEVYIAERTEK